MSYSKSKSGLSAVRMFPESVLAPPNTYTAAATSFTSAIRDGKGQAELHVAAANDTAFTLKILHSWRDTGPFTLDSSVAAAVDAETGLFTADIRLPITKRFFKIVVDAPAPGLGVGFELGAYLLPRASGGDLTASVVIGGVVSVAGSPGSTITNPADTAVGIGATVALPVAPGGTRRQVVQVTGGDSTTIIRVREVAAGAGRGRILQLYGSTLYGGLDGAIAALEVENVAGPIAAVHIDFEG